MKKYNLIFSALLFMFCISNVSAQLELKINPIESILGVPELSLEYNVSPQFSIEGSYRANLGSSIKIGNRFNFAAKYYLNPETSSDGYYAGLYVGKKDLGVFATELESQALAMGFMAGSKRVINSKFVLEAAMGIGGNFADTKIFPADLFFKLSVGYRF